MDPVKIFVCVFSLLLGAGWTYGRWVDENVEEWIRIRTRGLFQDNFASVRINRHGEREVRVAYGKVLALETFLPSGYAPEYDTVLQQVTDGRRILQAVYQGGTLKECDLTTESSHMLDFISAFVLSTPVLDDFGDVLYAAEMTNYTSRNTTLAKMSFKDVSYLKELADLVDMKSLKRDCREFIKIATKTAEEEAKSGHDTNVYEKILETLDPKDFEGEYGNLLHSNSDTKLTDSTSTTSGEQKPQTLNASKPTEHNISKRSKSTSTESENRQRKRRSTAPLKRNSRAKRAAFDFSSVLIFPGTKWCGKGDLAQCYDDLGDDTELDACCRDHDCCPYVIPPFSARFNTFNYRFHSLLHCDCDQRYGVLILHHLYYVMLSL